MSSQTSETPRASSTTSSKRPKVHHCDYEGCFKAFTRPSLLAQHQLTHSGERPFQCPECDKAFFRKSHLEAHLLSHSDDKPFKCSICGKGCNTAQHLRRHEITHTKSFKCDYEGCEETFYKHQQLRSHKLSVHEKSLTCQDCGKTFTRPYRLQNHRLKQHLSSAGQYQCTFPSCVKTFKTWSALQLHMKMDHPKLKCPECGKPCVGEEGLKNHMAIHDDKRVVKTWKCENCEQSFHKKDELVQHYNEEHDGLLPASLIAEAQEPAAKRARYDIDSFAAEVKMQKYLQSGGSSISLLVTSAGKEYKCPYPNCNRSYKTEYGLKSHLAKHQQLSRKMADRMTPETGEASIESCADPEQQKGPGSNTSDPVVWESELVYSQEPFSQEPPSDNEQLPSDAAFH